VVAPTFTPNSVSVSNAAQSYTAMRSGFFGTTASPRAVGTVSVAADADAAWDAADTVFSAAGSGEQAASRTAQAAQ